MTRKEPYGSLIYGGKYYSNTQPTLTELAHLTIVNIGSLKVKFKARHGKLVKYFYQKENGLRSRTAETGKENKRSGPHTTWP